jgi:hypothetical protein
MGPVSSLVSEVKNEHILGWKTKGTLPIVAKEA